MLVKLFAISGREKTKVCRWAIASADLGLRFDSSRTPCPAQVAGRRACTIEVPCPNCPKSNWCGGCWNRRWPGRGSRRWRSAGRTCAFPSPPGSATGCRPRGEALTRRAKYLLAALSSGETLLVHLGMSGDFRVERGAASDQGKHDHVMFVMSSGTTITFNDPRRFGLMDLVPAGRPRRAPAARSARPGAAVGRVRRRRPRPRLPPQEGRDQGGPARPESGGRPRQHLRERSAAGWPACRHGAGRRPWRRAPGCRRRPRGVSPPRS